MSISKDPPHKWSRKRLMDYLSRKRVGEADTKQLTMYDRDMEDQVVPSLPACCTFPDWTEADTFVVSGPLGTESGHRGERFACWEDAVRHYVERYGELPLAVYYNTRAPREGEGSRYGLRFHRRVLS